MTTCKHQLFGIYINFQCCKTRILAACITKYDTLSWVCTKSKSKHSATFVTLPFFFELPDVSYSTSLFVPACKYMSCCNCRKIRSSSMIYITVSWIGISPRNSYCQRYRSLNKWHSSRVPCKFLYRARAFLWHRATLGKSLSNSADGRAIFEKKLVNNPSVHNRVE